MPFASNSSGLKSVGFYIVYWGAGKFQSINQSTNVYRDSRLIFGTQYCYSKSYIKLKTVIPKSEKILLRSIF